MKYSEKIKQPLSENTSEFSDIEDTTLQENPLYAQIRDEVNQQWLQENNVAEFSSEHQDFMFGNVQNANGLTLEKKASTVFAEKYPELYDRYERYEKIRVYADIRKDPVYNEMMKELTIRTNTASQIRNASDLRVWQMVHKREELHTVRRFCINYPEKAQSYAGRWYKFLKNNPDFKIKDLSEEMSTYKMIADSIKTSNLENENRQKSKKEKVKNRDEKDIQTIRDLIQNTTTSGEVSVSNNNNIEDTNRSKAILDETLSLIKSNSSEIKSTSESKDALADIPYISGQVVDEIISQEGEHEGLNMVETKNIVGSESLAFENWSTEYQDRKDRAVNVAKKIKEGTEESIDYIFETKKPNAGIKLKKIEGPKGDVFFVSDGTHRVAGAKLINLERIPARIENINKISELETFDEYVKDEWETKIEQGLIDGYIEETNDSNPKTFKLKINSQVFPWAGLPYRKFLKMNKYYNKLYPRAFSDIKSLRNSSKKIPEEIFTNEVALNFYLANRWDEYKKINKFNY